MILETYLIMVAITTWIAGNGVLIMLYYDIVEDMYTINDAEIFAIGHIMWLFMSMLGMGLIAFIMESLIKPAIKAMRQ